MTRKKWRTTVGGNPATVRSHASQTAAYAAVVRNAEEFNSGTGRGSYTTVYVDEGNGWQMFERIYHADLAAR